MTKVTFKYYSICFVNAVLWYFYTDTKKASTIEDNNTLLDFVGCWTIALSWPGFDFNSSGALTTLSTVTVNALHKK